VDIEIKTCEDALIYSSKFFILMNLAKTIWSNCKQNVGFQY